MFLDQRAQGGKHTFIRLIVTIFFVLVSLQPNLAYAKTAGNTAERTLSLQLQPESVIQVPSEVSNLQDAINQVADGGTIEIASGTYNSPTGGFVITNERKGFTIRSAQGAQAILSGEGTHDILRFLNSDLSAGKVVTFIDLTFRDGYSDKQGVAGGLTLNRSESVFINCQFLNNHASASGSGGGVLLTLSATALFVDSKWEGNSAVNFGGGMAVEDGSRAFVHHSEFTGNRTNLPGHQPSSAGGGIHVGNSTLRVSNSRFENNQAGYVGGAIYGIGTWADPVTSPRTDMLVVNSTFISNQAFRDAGVSLNAPTEGGAFHAEGQTIAKIYNSRFLKNSAMAGGALTLYQAIVEIYGSVFQGNQATGTNSLGGFGGAISGGSNDTPSDGSINRRPASLIVQDSLIQGRYSGITTVGEGAGGIYMAGDFNRTYGQNGVGQMGSAEENRARLFLKRVVLNDLDVTRNAEGSAGGGILVDLVDLSIQDSLVMNSEAKGTTYGFGGGVAIIRNSDANINNTTLAGNSSEFSGGGVFVQGSSIHLLDLNLLGNTSLNSNYGSAIYSSPVVTSYANLAVTGEVQDCLISNQVGLEIYDNDRLEGPINDLRYNQNRFFTGGTNSIVYSDSIDPYRNKTVNELNLLTVQRSGVPSTDKSQADNTSLTNIPKVGSVLAVPAKILSDQAVGDSADPNPIYLGLAWEGNSANLNGEPVLEKAGILNVNTAGDYTLTVGGTDYTAHVQQALSPTTLLTASSEGDSITLNWSVQSGTFLDILLPGITINPSPSGSVQVPTSGNQVYYLYAITQEGGVFDTVDLRSPELCAPDTVVVLAGRNRPLVEGYLPFSNCGGGVLEWSATSQAPNLIVIQNQSGQTEVKDVVLFDVDAHGLNPGQYSESIVLDAGSAGSKAVTIQIAVVDYLWQSFLPSAIKEH